MMYGTIIGYNNNLINVSSYNKGWNKIPQKYKSKENFEMFCYLNYMGCDALSMFMEKIKL